MDDSHSKGHLTGPGRACNDKIMHFAVARGCEDAGPGVHELRGAAGGQVEDHRLLGEVEPGSGDRNLAARSRACVGERASVKEHVIFCARRLFDIESRHVREDERIGVEVGIDPWFKGFVVCPSGAHMGRNRECEKDDNEPLHLLFAMPPHTIVHAETMPCLALRRMRRLGVGDSSPMGSLYPTTIRESLRDIKCKKR